MGHTVRGRGKARGAGLRACLALLWLLLAAGCGGSAGPQRELADIPLPPGVERYAGAAETTLDGMWVSMTLSRPEQPRQRSVDYYWKLRDLTFEHVTAFYDQQLPPDGWQADQALDLPNVARWTRASDAGQQVLVVSDIGIGEEHGSILMLSLITE